MENSLQMNSQSCVKRKASEGSSLLQRHPNGIVDRKNRTVAHLMRSMLKDKSLSLEL